MALIGNNNNAIIYFLSTKFEIIQKRVRTKTKENKKK